MRPGIRTDRQSPSDSSCVILGIAAVNCVFANTTLQGSTSLGCIIVSPTNLETGAYSEGNKDYATTIGGGRVERDYRGQGTEHRDDLVENLLLTARRKDC